MASIQLGLNSQEPGALIDVALYSGSGSGPATLIESLGMVDESQMPDSYPTDFDTGAVILNSTPNPLLEAGVEYYIVATPGTSTSEAAWDTAPNTRGHCLNPGGGGWEYRDGDYDWQLASRVVAVPAPAEVFVKSVSIGHPGEPAPRRSVRARC